MVSPATFRESLLAEYRYCFAEVLAAGKIVNFHSCGCVDAVAADLAAIGVTVLNPVQARANDLAVLKPGGGYVCGPDQSIPGIPEENLIALWSAAAELGRY
jgi:hypothetical protein